MLFTASSFPMKLSRIYTSQCAQCHQLYHFDGRQHGVLNFGDFYLFDVEMFYDLMEHKVNSGLPTHAWWKTKVNGCLRIFPKCLETDKIRQRWMGLAGRLTSFLSEFLTIVEYPKSLFSCCEDPEIICADGKWSIS
jgi:hypothetical protein